jgi:hypothetical protein
MNKAILFAIMIGTTSLGEAVASPTDIWDCILSVDDSHPFKIHTLYAVIGDDLQILGGTGILGKTGNYRILKNDAIAVIAAGQLSYVSPIGGPITSGELIVIDKRGGAIRRGSIFLASDGLSGPTSSSGSCKKIVGEFRKGSSHP